MKEDILGVQVCSLNYDELINEIAKDIEAKRKSFIVAINPEKIFMSLKDEKLKNLLNSATYQIPDGTGILIASKLNSGKITSRVTGIDLMKKLCEFANKEGKKIFLYGGKPGVAESASVQLKKEYPNLNIVGTLDGYQKDSNLVIEEINKKKPDILFVALGSPKQERWITENMDKVDAHIFQGVGGSFDVISGNVKRAPVAFQKLGLEWLHRLILQPWRYKRILNVFKFLFIALKYKNKK